MYTLDKLKKYGEPSWLLSLYYNTVQNIRELGLPSKDKGALSIEVPTLMDQARGMLAHRFKRR